MDFIAFVLALSAFSLTLTFEMRLNKPNRLLLTDLQKRVAELEAAAGKNNPDSDS